MNCKHMPQRDISGVQHQIDLLRRAEPEGAEIIAAHTRFHDGDIRGELYFTQFVTFWKKRHGAVLTVVRVDGNASLDV